MADDHLRRLERKARGPQASVALAVERLRQGRLGRHHVCLSAWAGGTVAARVLADQGIAPPLIQPTWINMWAWLRELGVRCDALEVDPRERSLPFVFAAHRLLLLALEHLHVTDEERARPDRPDPGPLLAGVEAWIDAPTLASRRRLGLCHTDHAAHFPEYETFHEALLLAEAILEPSSLEGLARRLHHTLRSVVVGQDAMLPEQSAEAIDATRRALADWALDVWPELAAGADSPRSYSPRDHYAVGEALDHARFGAGEVVRVTGSWIEVSFVGQTRRLAQGR